jgi:hypothetical protein
MPHGPAWIVALALAFIGLQTPPATPSATADSGVIGRVVDAESGAPIAGAAVSLLPYRPADPADPANLPQRALTDDNGAFAFGPIRAQNYLLSAVVAGYLDGGYGRARPDAPSTPLELALRTLVEGAEIRLWKGATVGGAVTDDFGEPAIGVLVNVMRREWLNARAQWTVIGSPITDDRGMYRLANLAPGEYTAFVPNMRTTYPDGFRITAAVSGAFFDLGQYGMPFNPIVNGSPSLPQNRINPEPAGAAANERIGAVVTQSTQGARSIEPALGVRGGSRGFATTFAPGRVSVEDARAVALAAGEATTSLDIQLALVPLHDIGGTVPLDGEPMANVVVRLVHADAPRGLTTEQFDVALAVTDAAGAFTMPAVPAGAYRLSAAPRAGAQRGAVAFGEQSVSIGDEDVRDVRLALGHPPTVSGRIVTAPDVPAGTRLPTIQLFPDVAGFTASGQQTQAGPDGRFTLSAAPGRYALGIIAPPPWGILSATAGGRDLSAASIDLDRELNDVVLTLTMTPAGVSGTVRTADAAVDPGATALIWPVDRARWGDGAMRTRLFQEAPADRHGVYAARGLASGEYYIVALPSSQLDATRDTAFYEGLIPIANRVTVREGDVTTHDLKTAAVR